MYKSRQNQHSFDSIIKVDLHISISRAAEGCLITSASPKNADRTDVIEKVDGKNAAEAAGFIAANSGLSLRTKLIPQSKLEIFHQYPNRGLEQGNNLTLEVPSRGHVRAGAAEAPRMVRAEMMLNLMNCIVEARGSF